MAQVQQEANLPKDPESARPEEPVMLVHIDESVVVTAVPVDAASAPADGTSENSGDAPAADVVTYVETTSKTLAIPLANEQTGDEALNAATAGLSLDEKAGAGRAASEPGVVLVFAGGPYSVNDDTHDNHCHQCHAKEGGCRTSEKKEAEKAASEGPKAAEGAGGFPPSAEVGGAPAQSGSEEKRSAMPAEAAGGAYPVGDEVHGSHSVEAKVPEKIDGNIKTVE